MAEAYSTDTLLFRFFFIASLLLCFLCSISLIWCFRGFHAHFTQLSCSCLCKVCSHVSEALIHGFSLVSYVLQIAYISLLATFWYQQYNVLSFSQPQTDLFTCSKTIKSLALQLARRKKWNNGKMSICIIAKFLWAPIMWPNSKQWQLLLDAILSSIWPPTSLLNKCKRR